MKRLSDRRTPRVGDRVLMRVSKDRIRKPKWTGPFTVAHTTKDSLYRYQLRKSSSGALLKTAVRLSQLKIHRRRRGAGSSAKTRATTPKSLDLAERPSTDWSTPQSSDEHSTSAVDPSPCPPPTITISSGSDSECDSADWWIKDLAVTEVDRRVLEGGHELNDKIIYAAQNVLRQQFPNIHGLQDPLLAEKNRFDCVQGDAVQVHHTGSFHWVTSFSNGSRVTICDSMAGDLTENLQVQLSTIYRLLKVDNTLVINMKDVQQQEGGRQCGLFAIAFATEICFGKDPSHASFSEEYMADHLRKCLEKGRFQRFPQHNISIEKCAPATFTINSC